MDRWALDVTTFASDEDVVVIALVTDVRVRQPRKNDVVSDRFAVAGIGAGFEGTIGLRVLGPRGRVLATDSAQSSGGGTGVGDFAARVRVLDPPRAGTRLTVQVFGDNPGLPDEGPSPGFNTREVEVICFPNSHGFLIYRGVSSPSSMNVATSTRRSSFNSSGRWRPDQKASRAGSQSCKGADESGRDARRVDLVDELG